MQRTLQLVILTPHISIVFNQQIDQLKVLFLHCKVQSRHTVLILKININCLVFIVAYIDHFCNLLEIALFDTCHELVTILHLLFPPRLPHELIYLLRGHFADLSKKIRRFKF